MKSIIQKERLENMMRCPIAQKKIGIIHLQMIRESRILYGMYRFSQPKETVEMVKPLFAMADREMMLVMSLNTKMEPIAVCSVFYSFQEQGCIHSALPNDAA